MPWAGIWRLAGADHIHVNGLANKFCESDACVIASARSCLTPLFPGKPFTAMPVFSSGQTVRQVPGTWAALGSADLIYAAGRRIAFTAALGGDILISNAGPAARRDAILRAIAAALPDCEESGVTLAIENPGHGAGDLVGNAAEGAALVAVFDTPRLRLNYDTGNVYTYSGRRQPADDLGGHLGSVAHLHLKDMRDANGDWIFCAVGAGAPDDPALWETLTPELAVNLALPLRLWRPGHGDPVRSPDPVAPPDIERALRLTLTDLERWRRAAAST